MYDFSMNDFQKKLFIVFYEENGEFLTVYYADGNIEHYENTEANKERLNLRMKKQVEERKQKRFASQPLNLPSAGSVFRNPENMYAGELIEKCNLKGYNINGAEVSTKHANFIVNVGGATGKDIIALINTIKGEVQKEYHVELKLEQIIIE